jgi:ribosomal protein L17
VAVFASLVFTDRVCVPVGRFFHFVSCSNMVTSLIEHERILTTHTKAKYAQRYAEKMVAYARANTVTSYRKAYAFVRGQENLKKLFGMLAQRYASVMERKHTHSNALGKQ